MLPITCGDVRDGFFHPSPTDSPCRWSLARAHGRDIDEASIPDRVVWGRWKGLIDVLGVFLENSSIFFPQKLAEKIKLERERLYSK